MGTDRDELLERYTKAHVKKVQSLHKMLAGVISPWLRWTVFSVNVVFWFVGLCMILLGIWAFLQKRINLESKTIKSILEVITDIGIVLAVIGFVIFVLAFAGCVGILRQNISLLRFFRKVLVFILGIQIVLLISVVAFSTSAIEYIRKFTLVTAIVGYREDLDLQNFVDWAQLSLRCCGVGINSYLDWNLNRYFNCTDTNPSNERCSLPFSCCISPNNIDENIINTRCAYKILEKEENTIKATVWPYGCVDKIILFVKQHLVATCIVLLIYLVCYCLVIDVIERLISQIEQFRQQWFTLYAKHDSIDQVHISDLIEEDYQKHKRGDKVASKITTVPGRKNTLSVRRNTLFPSKNTLSGRRNTLSARRTTMGSKRITSAVKNSDDRSPPKRSSSRNCSLM